MKRVQLQVGKPVSGNDLIGRETEVETMIQLLRAGQSIVLVAPRRFGKTSIMLEVLNRLKKEGFYTLYTDIFSSPDLFSLANYITASVLDNRKFGKHFRRLKGDLSGILKNVEFRQEIEDYSFVLKFNQSGQDSWELFGKSIDFIDDYPNKFNKTLIAGMDEFGDVLKLDGDKIIKFLRAKIQMQKNAVYIFSGSYESVMDKIFVGHKSPFYRLTRIIQLGFIDKGVFKEYLHKKLKSASIEADLKYIETLLDFTNGHPYYTQLFLQELIIYQTLNPKEKLPQINIIIDRLLLTEKSYLEKNWGELGSGKESRTVLLALAKQADIIYSRVNSKSINIPRTINKLIGQGVIYHNEKEYHFTDPLFRYWIRKSILGLDNW